MNREKLTALRRHVELGVTALALAAIDAELAVPEVREWRVVYGYGEKLRTSERPTFEERSADGPWDSEDRARSAFNGCVSMPDWFTDPRLESRIKSIPASPWEVA